MPPPSTSTIEECRKHLIPVLLASAQARDPGKRLDSEQCSRLLSDDHCRAFFRQAKDMKRQLSPSISQKTPVNQCGSGSLKRDRVDDVGAWVRSTRSRFDSANTVVSDVSRKDSDITLVDFVGGRSPPKAPRAMLQASRAAAQDEAPNAALVASPTTEGHPASGTSLFELVKRATKMFPSLMPTSKPVAEIDTSNVPVGQSSGDQPGQVASPTHAVPSGATDFVSHLPGQPGIWFKQQGTPYAEIVNVDIDVSDEMFYMSTERCVSVSRSHVFVRNFLCLLPSRPFRLRMHLRLCSVPVGAATKNTLTSPEDVDGAIERHALHWPKRGTLVVQVNPESERSKTWLPYTLVSAPPSATRFPAPRARALTPIRSQIRWTSRHVCVPERTPFVSFSCQIYPSLLLCWPHRLHLLKRSGALGTGRPSSDIRTRNLHRQTLLRMVCQSLDTFLSLFGRDVFRRWLITSLLYTSMSCSMIYSTFPLVPTHV